MSAEHHMRLQVCELLSVLDAHPVENSVGPGTPDVNCTLGWIELKCMKGWPKTGHTLYIDHFTQRQRHWIKRRAIASGGVWVLLKVALDWILLPGEWSADRLGRCTHPDIVAACIAMWGRKPTPAELVGALLKSAGPRYGGRPTTMQQG